MKRKALVLIALFTALSFTGHAQEGGLNRADKKYDRFAYIDAIKTYERIAEKGYKSADLFQKLGNSYYFNSQFDKAAKWYGELFAMGGDIDSEYYYRYAQSLKSIGETAKAGEMMDQFAAKVADDNRAKIYNDNKDYMAVIKKNSGRYELGDAGVNTEFSDYGSATVGGKLVFASARDTGNFSKRIHQWTGQYFTNLYAAEVKGDSLGEVEKFGKKANSKFNDATSPAFTKDGKTMYFTRNNYIDGKRGRDGSNNTLVKIYKAQLVQTGKKDKDGNDIEEWDNVTEVPFNSDAYNTAHPSLSADGKTMYFASDMPGTLGQSDIWKVAISDDGSFGKPENLGPTINTPGKETFPVMTDEDELYFATDGHPGLGGLDLFMARLKTDGTWRNPVNLGEPANSPKDDFAYLIDTKTRKGFLSSNRDNGKGNDDIYKFLETRKLICEQLLSGIVTDAQTGEILPGAKVTLMDDKFNVIATVIADDKGYYEFEVECDTTYYVRGEHEGYETKEQKIKIPAESGKTDLPIPLEKKVKPVTIGDDLAKAFGIKEIYFDLDKWNIRPDAAIELEKILDVLVAYPTMKLDIRSHTDCRASHKYNEKLSDRRAKSTIAWLIENGVAADRLTGRGYGETQLVNKCADGVPCSEEEHQLNRRSQFIITALEQEE
jgi:outer membrane protein OmpA-like peptidoglycan-associated protein/tetratricopeptide (TPR) repeat protein